MGCRIWQFLRMQAWSLDSKSYLKACYEWHISMRMYTLDWNEIEIMLCYVCAHALAVSVYMSVLILVMDLSKPWDLQTPSSPASEKLYLITFWMLLACVFFLASTLQPPILYNSNDHNIKSPIFFFFPGLVDAHTHPVWAGDRVHEFAMKVDFKSLQSASSAFLYLHLFT